MSNNISTQLIQEVKDNYQIVKYANNRISVNIKSFSLLAKHHQIFTQKQIIEICLSEVSFDAPDNLGAIQVPQQDNTLELIKYLRGTIPDSLQDEILNNLNH